jgi:hypothetical protein
VNNPQYLVDYVHLGCHMQRLRNPCNRQYTDIVEEINDFIDLTKDLGFQLVAAEMKGCLGVLEKEHEEKPDTFRAMSLTDAASSSGEILPQKFHKRISEIIRRFHERLKAHAARQVVEIDRSVVSDALRKLRTSARDEHQARLVDEAISCLECGSYRAAIVTGWNLALDHFRQWIFSSKRKRVIYFIINFSVLWR